MARRISKRIQSAQAVDNLKESHSIEQAVELLDKMPKAKFDETVELSVALGVNPKQSNQMVRGVVELPNGSGKKLTLAAFVENTEAALQAGADYAGLDDLIQKVKDGWTSFDVAVATPSAMKEVRTIARVLGPRGLMPNPKSGTVSDDITQAIQKIKKGGQVEFKMDKTANVAIIMGKRSFDADKLIENIRTAIEVLGRSRPSELKGRFIKNMTLSSSMSPGIKLINSLFSHF